MERELKLISASIKAYYFCYAQVPRQQGSFDCVAKGMVIAEDEIAAKDAFIENYEAKLRTGYETMDCLYKVNAYETIRVKCYKVIDLDVMRIDAHYVSITHDVSFWHELYMLPEDGSAWEGTLPIELLTEQDLKKLSAGPVLTVPDSYYQATYAKGLRSKILQGFLQSSMAPLSHCFLDVDGNS